jgi:hypothetical protein
MQSHTAGTVVQKKAMEGSQPRTVRFSCNSQQDTLTGMISYSTDVKTVLKELKGVSNISCLTPKS